MSHTITFMIRKALVGLSTSVLTSLLLAGVLVASLAFTLQSGHVKKWLSDSDVYNNLVEGVLTSAVQNPQEINNVNNIPLTNPGVQAAINKSFTPAFLQKSTENAVNGTFHWLNGKVSMPDFSIDLRGAKANVATNIGAYILTRYNMLPTCPKFTLPSSSDVFQINCRPAFNFDIAAAIQSITKDIKNSKDFLPDPVITANTLTVASGVNIKQPFYKKFHNLPRYYHWLKIAPYVLGFLALLCTAGVLYGSPSNRRGLRHLATSLTIAGVLLLVLAISARLAFNKTQQHLLSQHLITNTILQQDALSIFHSAINNMSRVVLWFAIPFVVAAIAVFIYLLVFRYKARRQKLN